jgi:hypothetical protein
MASDVAAAQDLVILASFENRHGAEHMLASLGRGFRVKHRKGHVTALVVSGNKDGSLEVTPEAVTSAGSPPGVQTGSLRPLLQRAKTAI